MKCQCVVFDMDGVLFDSEALVLQCWELTAEKHQIDHVRSTCQKCLGSNAAAAKQKFLETYGADFPYDEYKAEMSALYWEHVQAGWLALKPGVREILAALRENHFAIGIASSTRQIVIRKQLAMFGLENSFDQIIGGDMVHRSKPEPEIYLRACDALGISPGVAYAVEDSYNGIRAASRAGMHPVMIPDLLPPTAEMEQLAEHIFPDMQAFQEFLFSR
ncbi:HAD family phosphatase [uncultured Ruminococcus sp.]|uniref:HAD family hydrolase n=1 Tax=uncultured Ruminococcus sp. TaxID=165186 RepID=UPI002613D362|nr:HAD family phosphatase [uncultured Ruminococcus sp.]